MATATPSYVLGIDGGGSKTEAVILDAKVQVLGRGFGGPANYLNVGLAATRTALQTATEAALAAAGLSLRHLAGATLALAGVGRPEDRRRIEALAAEFLPGLPVQVNHDALAALVGGVGGRRGIALIAGTGMIAYGEDGAGRKARGGGWGVLLDQGSGYALGLAALRAVLQSEDGSRPPTHLGQRLQEALNLPHLAAIPNWLYHPDRTSAEVAALAALVLAAAKAGDLAAVEITAQGAAALAEAVDSVARRLDLWGRPFPLALSGGLLTGNDFYRQLVIQTIQTRTPGVRPQLPLAGAAVGAGLLALEMLGRWPLLDVPTPDEANIVWASEQRNLLTRQLDLQTSLEMAGLMHLADHQAVAAIRPLLPQVAIAVEQIAERMRQGGRLLYVGAGTSGRLGVLDASECPPTFNADPSQVVGLIAGGRVALTDAVEGAEDDRQAGAADLTELDVGPLDSVVGIAASGRTPYVIGALAAARDCGALTIALTCNLPAPVAEQGELVLAPLVGPEVVTGSTRLKAGTAQKLLLNMLSTLVMVRLGKTYGNLMVDVQQTNRKLRARARRIVAQACEIDEQTAAQALAAADDEVKTAIVSHLLTIPAAEARQRLAQAGGVIRQALDSSVNTEVQLSNKT